jgi:hypothetical protein
LWFKRVTSMDLDNPNCHLRFPSRCFPLPLYLLPMTTMPASSNSSPITRCVYLSSTDVKLESGRARYNRSREAIIYLKLMLLNKVGRTDPDPMMLPLSPTQRSSSLKGMIRRDCSPCSGVTLDSLCTRLARAILFDRTLAFLISKLSSSKLSLCTQFGWILEK